MWWARVNVNVYSSKHGYGSWVPTGCAAMSDAEWYVETYPGRPLVHEWLWVAP